MAERDAREQGSAAEAAPGPDGSDGAAEAALHELPEASSRLLAELERVHELERTKRTKPVSSPEFHELADEILDRSRQVFRYADHEEEIGDRTNPGDDTIDDVAEHRRS